MNAAPTTTAVSLNVATSRGGQSATRPVVAYQGMPGAFSDEAVRTIWGGAVESLPMRDFASTVAAVSAGRASHALIPVHNSAVGPIAAGVAALAGNDAVLTVGHVTIDIRIALLAPRGASLDSIQRVSSHPAALAQCSQWFASHPDIAPAEAFDTAGAAWELTRNPIAGMAVLAPASAAEIYGLDVLARDVHDDPHNATRFAIVTCRTAAIPPTAPAPALGTPDGATQDTELQNWLEVHVREPVNSVGQLRAIRGAITVPRDDSTCVSVATRTLLTRIMVENALSVDDLVSAVFTVTRDIRSGFPALAARGLPGWSQVPLLCAAELDIVGALPHCLRVLLHAYVKQPDFNARHVYLEGARVLRPDIAGSDEPEP